MALTYPLVRYLFEFEATSTLRLPEYAGSTLRGAFGHALRQLACTTRAKTCEGCLLRAICPYPSVFAPPPRTNSLGNLATPPVPYVIEPPQWGARDYSPGEVISFGFTLIGRAADSLPLCIMAWRRAFSRGVGAGDGTAELVRVLLQNDTGATCIHQPGDRIEPHTKIIQLDNTPAPTSLTLIFDTPLRLQENGRALSPNRLTPRPLLTALVRRASLLAEYHGNGPLWDATTFAKFGEQAGHIQGQQQLVWRDWTRRSSRQQQTMMLGGGIGSWLLQGKLAPFWDALRLGEWLHVGKESSFGLGRYRLTHNTQVSENKNSCETPMQATEMKGELPAVD